MTKTFQAFNPIQVGAEEKIQRTKTTVRKLGEGAENLRICCEAAMYDRLNNDASKQSPLTQSNRRFIINRKK
jgi:hypothetical protein